MTFSRKERLKSHTEIRALFEHGTVFYSPPFKFVWKFSATQAAFPVQVVFSVPKRIHKKAVTRNLIKRRSREAYRLNKLLIYSYLADVNQSISLAVIYTSRQVLPYADLEQAIKNALAEKLPISIQKKTIV